MKGLFITGTDTGVGKTVVSSLIIRGLIRRGLRVGAMKPVETGCVCAPDQPVEADGRPGRRLIPRDGLFLRDAAGMDDPLDLVTPVRFAPPLAPLMAADIERSRVDIAAVKEAFTRLSSRYEFMIVEGVGGLLVPLCLKGRSAAGPDEQVYYVIDLVRDLGLPLVIVTRPSLGTINHTLLTLRAAAEAGVKTTGICINHATPAADDLAERTNPAALARLCGVPVIGNVPCMGEISVATLDAFASCVDIPL